MGTLILLCLGGSLEAASFFWQPPSPCAMLAEREHLVADVRAHSGKNIADMMCATAEKSQTDCATDAEIEAAKLVTSFSGWYWFGGSKPECERAQAAAEHLFAVRKGKEMILATVPGSFGIKDCINPVLRERCKEKCVLVEAEEFAGLHPERVYLERHLEKLYNLRQRSN